MDTSWGFYDLAPGSAAETTPMASLSRVTSHMEIWWVGGDGSVQGAYWDDNGKGWNRYQLAPAGSASTDGGMAALSRVSEHQELWWTGPDGSVQGAYWDDNGTGWHRYQLAPAGSASTQGGITALSPTSGHQEVWWIALDGSVQAAYHDEDGTGWHRYQLASGASASWQSSIVSVSRTDEAMEVWWTGANGSVQGAYHYTGAPWGRYELAPFGSASPQGGMAALARTTAHMEVWWTGPQGSVDAAYWDDDGSGWHRYRLAGLSSAYANGGMTALARGADHTEIWWTGVDGSVQGAYWSPGQPWGLYTFTSAGSAQTVGGMTALSRLSTSMEVWCIGDDHSVQGGYRYDGQVAEPVQRLIDNGPFGKKITMVVVGDGFATPDQVLFNRWVDRVLVGGLFTHDFYAAERSSFDVVRVNVHSQGSGVSTKTYNADGTVTEHDNDTYFGAFFNGAWAHCWVEDGPDTATRLKTLLDAHVPDRRLTFLLLNNPGFGGCGGGGRLTLPMGVTWDTIAHECGHALGSLADEYHQDDKAYTGGEDGLAPNVTTTGGSLTGLKWASFVAAGTPIPTGADDYTPPKPATWDDSQSVGAFEGGAASYKTGIYRPSVNDRMHSNLPPFCPVCAQAMHAQTDAFATSPTEPAAGTRRAMRRRLGDEGTRMTDDSYLRMTVRNDHGRLSIVSAQQVAGGFVEPPVRPAGLVQEVTVRGATVALSAIDQDAVSRSFENIGPEGPIAHHRQDLDSYEFVVRVPSHALAAVPAADVQLTVRRADSEAGPDFGAVRAERLGRPVATASLAELELPDGIRHLLAD